jgi:phenylacetate-CoA ligase
VITCLHAYAMPFIRYALGDIAEKGPELCPCGQPFSTIARIHGRADDYFRMPDGRFVHPDEIVIQPIVSRENSWIRQYQLVQETETRVIMEIEPMAPPTGEEIAFIEKSAAQALGSGIEFHVHLVDKIPFEPSGKLRIRRSLVASDFDSEVL